MRADRVPLNRRCFNGSGVLLEVIGRRGHKKMELNWWSISWGVSVVAAFIGGNLHGSRLGAQAGVSSMARSISERANEAMDVMIDTNVPEEERRRVLNELFRHLVSIGPAAEKLQRDRDAGKER